MVEFGILGPLEARRDGQELALGGRNQRAVLALLLLNANRVVSIDRLAEDLYRGATPVSAVTQVHRQVSELRRVLADGERVIETRPPGYVVRIDRGALDAHRFEAELGRAAEAAGAGDFATAGAALVAGLDLWRGPALADLAGEPFAQGAVARLEELRLGALEDRLEAELALGHHARVAAELRDLVAAHPYRERLRGLLMTALYRDGRQVEALEAFRAARQVLVEAFGVEPGPALQTLQAAILRQEEDLGGGPAPPTDRAPGAVVLAAREPDRVAGLASVAAAFARRPQRELVVALLAEDESGLAAASEALTALSVEPRARTAAFVARRTSEDVLHLARSNDAELVLVEGGLELAQPGGPDPDLVALLDRSAADLAFLYPPHATAAPGGGVLVPFGGSEHDWTAVELGAWLATASGERLLVAGVRADPDRGQRDASRLLADASLAVQRVVGVSAEPLLLAPGADALAAAAESAAAVVVGLSSRWRSEGLGATRRSLVERRRGPVLVVHRGPRPSGIAPRESATRFTWTIAPPT